MKKIQRVIAAVIAVLIISTTTYNYTFTVQAVGAAGAVVTGSAFIDFLISIGVIGFCGFEMSDIDRDEFYAEFLNYAATPNGKSYLEGYYKAYNMHLVKGESGQPPEPPENSAALIAAISGGAVVMCKELLDLTADYYRYLTESSTSGVGSVISDACNQEITYAPFPSNWHFSSVDNPVYNPYSVDFFRSKYPVFTLEGNSFIEIYTPFDNDSFMMCDLYDDSHIYFSIGRTHITFGTQYNDSSIYNGVNYIRSLKDDYCNRLTRNSTQAIYKDSTHLYICGNVHFMHNGNSYVLNPDGTIVQVVDGQPDQLVIPHLITAEGYLTSVKPIVGMDISAFIDAIGKSIADAHPEEAPVLSPEAVAAVISGLAGVYNDAVTNYYNDTSYIDQSQYITNITNVYEQAIADNPAIDDSDTDTGILSSILMAIKAIPKQILKVLEDVFIPDIALYKTYFLNLKSKFAFVGGIIDFGSGILTMLFDSDPEIPKLIIDFSLAESEYYYGGRSYALDMTFYDRFKPYVDNIIVSFSWVAFAYWFYKNLPEIISGSILSRKDYAIVKETGNVIVSANGSFSKDRVKEIRDIDKIKIEKDSNKKKK